jgi:hypothetical protein
MALQAYAERISAHPQLKGNANIQDYSTGSWANETNVFSQKTEIFNFGLGLVYLFRKK